MKFSEAHARNKFFGMAPFFCGQEETYFGSQRDWHQADFHLVEAAFYQGGDMHAIFLKKSQSLAKVNFKRSHDVVNKLTFSFIYNIQEPYFSFKNQCQRHYTELIKNLAFNTVLDFVFVDQRIFDMSAARNECIKRCESGHQFLLDVDTLLSDEDVANVLNVYNHEPHCGVVSLKPDFLSGNGLYFGHNQIFKSNPYYEGFKKFWHEDTEFFMNLSRAGHHPLVMQITPTLLSHARGHTQSVNSDDNYRLMEAIIHSKRL